MLYPLPVNLDAAQGRSAPAIPISMRLHVGAAVRRWCSIAVCATALLGSLACDSTGRLPVTPYVLSDGSGAQVLRSLPQDQQHPEMQLMYVTDREKVTRSSATLAQYTSLRGTRRSFGTATVSMGDRSTTWADVCAAAGRAQHVERCPLEVTAVHERSPASDTPEPGASSPSDKESAAFREHLEAGLRGQGEQDVFLFLHGFNSEFDESLVITAGLWHHLGRKGLAIAYSWPAGEGGMFGYFYSRESSEFTVPDLKWTIRAIAASPLVSRIHIIAHSRGADPVVIALRELKLECEARGQDPRDALKLQTVVLAAPDLEVETFDRRFVMEDVASAAKRTVVYVSANDRILTWAAWACESSPRLGQIDLDDLTPQQRQLVAHAADRIELVACDVDEFTDSHDYSLRNPAALSDLIVVLRDGKRAGIAAGRPLTPQLGAWRLDANYMKRPKQAIARSSYGRVP